MTLIALLVFLDTYIYDKILYLSVISSCSTSSPGYHADSGLCFGLFDLDLRKYDKARDECSLATINDQSKWDFIKSAASDIFQGISE